MYLLFWNIFSKFLLLLLLLCFVFMFVCFIFIYYFLLLEHFLAGVDHPVAKVAFTNTVNRISANIFNHMFNDVTWY